MRIKFFILTFLSLFFGASPVFADSVVINEIMAKPISPEKEWVELYNNSPSDTDITQWVITELTASGNINSHPLPSVIMPPNSSCFFEFLTAVLNNDGDTISLNNSSGTQIDSYTYTSIASTTSGKTFSRVPDGDTWQTNLTEPTKSNIDCNNLLSPSPTPTLTPSPTSTAAPSDIPQTTSSFTISNIPSQINSDQSFPATVNLSQTDNPNTKFFLKGAFRHRDKPTNYFGLTKVGSTWVKNGMTATSQLQITTDQNGNWTDKIEVQPDSLDSGFIGTDDYFFKVARYDQDGENLTWSNETTIKINNVTTPSNNPSPQPTPKTSPSASLTKLQSLAPKPTPSLKSSYQIASVAGAQTATPEGKVEIQNQKQTNPIIWIGLIFVFAGGSTLGYIYLKKNAKIHIPFGR